VPNIEKPLKKWQDRDEDRLMFIVDTQLYHETGMKIIR